MGRIEDDGFVALWRGPGAVYHRGSGVHGEHYDVMTMDAEADGWPVDLWLTRIDRTGAELDTQLVISAIHGLLVSDYDGDGHPDVSVDRNGKDDHAILFGSADDEFSVPQPFPADTEDDEGILQSFDIDADGRVELLMAFPTTDDRLQWRALGWRACD
jgi:hypothetical protein